MSSQMYSIKNELHILRRFVDMEYDGSRRCYSEEDISVVEERLHYKLPCPIRELYLYMSDILLDMYYLRPLELLHWHHDYLGFFDVPEEGIVWGICRKDAPNTLYEWEEYEYIPEEMKDDIYDYEEEFEELDIEDVEEKQILTLKYLACWDKINAKCVDKPPKVKKLENEFRHNCCLDANCLFLVIHTLYAYGTELYCLKNLKCYSADFPDMGEANCGTEALKGLREKIEQNFIPITAHMELVDITPLPMAYIHKTGNTLLLCQEWDLGVTLLTNEKDGQSFINDMQKQLDLSFRIVKWP